MLLMLLALRTQAADALRQIDGESYRISLPQSWSASVRDDIHTYRSPDHTKSLTVGIYEMEPADEAQRLQLLHKSADLRRAKERELSGGRVNLSDVAVERQGEVLVLRYSGEEPATDRRFVNLTVATPRWLQNFYYEALGDDAGEFRRTSQVVLGRLEVQQRRAR